VLQDNNAVTDSCIYKALDFRKAFNTVLHRKLVASFASYGICGSLYCHSSMNRPFTLHAHWY